MPQDRQAARQVCRHWRDAVTQAVDKVELHMGACTSGRPGDSGSELACRRLTKVLNAYPNASTLALHFAPMAPGPSGADSAAGLTMAMKVGAQAATPGAIAACATISLLCTRCVESLLCARCSGAHLPLQLL